MTAAKLTRKERYMADVEAARAAMRAHQITTPRPVKTATPAKPSPAVPRGSEVTPRAPVPSKTRTKVERDRAQQLEVEAMLERDFGMLDRDSFATQLRRAAAKAAKSAVRPSPQPAAPAGGSKPATPLTAAEYRDKMARPAAKPTRR